MVLLVEKHKLSTSILNANRHQHMLIVSIIGVLFNFFFLVISSSSTLTESSKGAEARWLPSHLSLFPFLSLSLYIYLLGIEYTIEVLFIYMVTCRSICQSAWLSRRAMWALLVSNCFCKGGHGIFGLNWKYIKLPCLVFYILAINVEFLHDEVTMKQREKWLFFTCTKEYSLVLQLSTFLPGAFITFIGFSYILTHTFSIYLGIHFYSNWVMDVWRQVLMYVLVHNGVCNTCGEGHSIKDQIPKNTRC